MAGPIIAESELADPLAAQVAQVRAFNRFYTNVIGVLHGMYLDSPYTLTEGRVLFEIARRPAVEVSWLRRELDIDAGYLSRVLGRFEADSLVTRRRSEADARRQEIRVTEAGRAAMAELDRRAAQQIGVLLRGADCGRLLDAMWVITEVLGRPEETGASGHGAAEHKAAEHKAAEHKAAEHKAAEHKAAVHETAGRVVTLRPLGPGDLGWVLQRHGTRYSAEFGWDASFEAVCAVIIAEFTTKRDAAPDRTAGWIAEVDGVSAGSIFCVPDSETTGRLRLLLVEPWARGLGIGARLVGECLRFAREAEYSDIVLWTYDRLAAARRIYMAAGFTLVSEEQDDAFGDHMMSQTWSRLL